jgi:hypothetical protein
MIHPLADPWKEFNDHSSGMIHAITMLHNSKDIGRSSLAEPRNIHFSIISMCFCSPELIGLFKWSRDGPRIREHHCLFMIWYSLPFCVKKDFSTQINSDNDNHNDCWMNDCVEEPKDVVCHIPYTDTQGKTNHSTSPIGIKNCQPLQWMKYSLVHDISVWLMKWND